VQEHYNLNFFYINPLALNVSFSLKQHNAEDVECQMNVTAFVSLPYTDLT